MSLPLTLVNGIIEIQILALAKQLEKIQTKKAYQIGKPF
jgi:hypothetical protein